MENDTNKTTETMKAKGFIRSSDNAIYLQAAINELCNNGVEADRITIGKDIDLLLDSLQQGDVLVVYSLTDVCNGVLSLLRILNELAHRGAALKSLDAPWLDLQAGYCDWTGMLEGLSVFGSQIISERTRAALDKVRASGKKLGRPQGLSPRQRRQYNLGIQMYRTSDMSVSSICGIIHVDPSNFYKYIKAHEPDILRKKRPDHGSQPDKAPEQEPKPV